LATAFRNNSRPVRLAVLKNPSRSVRARQRRGDTTLIVVLVITGILITVLVTLLAMGVFSTKRIPRLPAAKFETAESRFQEAAKAFDAPDVDLNDPEVKAIHEAFESLRKEFVKRDRKSLREMFDITRLYQETMRWAPNIHHTPREQREFIKGMDEGISNSLVARADLMAFDRFEIRKCRFSADRKEVSTFVRMDRAVGALKIRWWLIRHDEKWLFYDFEELDGGLRWSSATAEALKMTQTDVAKVDELQRQADLLGRGSQAIVNGDLDEADRCFQQLHPDTLGPAYAGLVYMGRGTIHLHRGNNKEALVQYDLADQICPDMARLNFLRASAHNNLGEYETARKNAEKYLNQLGADAEGFEQLGIALEGLSRKDEALAAYRKGLDEDRNSLANLYHLALNLPIDNKVEAGERFAKMHRTEEQFDTLYEWLRWSDPAAMQEIAKQYALVAPGNAKIALLKANDLLKKEDYEGAAQCAKTALAAAADENVKAQLLWSYCNAMRQLNREAVAYQELSRSEEAFTTLAGGLIGDEHYDRLKLLVEVHRANSPNDPWLHFYSALVAIQDNRADEGIQQLRTALDLAKDDATKSTIRTRLVSEMFSAGRALEALDQLEPKPDVFEQLASAAKFKKQSETLQSLIDAFRKLEPTSPAISRREMELAYLKQDYDTTIDIARRLRSTAGDAEEDYSYLYDDHLIRSLIALKRFDEVERELQGFKPDSDPSWYRTLISAARGDVGQSSANFEKLVADGWEPWEFYDDDILGPALRSEAFKSLREKYPEPKEAATEQGSD
jgi:tetratricopeptide (TPR) repeat protein